MTIMPLEQAYPSPFSGEPVASPPPALVPRRFPQVGTDEWPEVNQKIETWLNAANINDDKTMKSSLFQTMSTRIKND